MSAYRIQQEAERKEPFSKGDPKDERASRLLYGHTERPEDTEIRAAVCELTHCGYTEWGGGAITNKQALL